MDGFEPSALQGAAGFLLLAALFVVRELASGALKKAGEELWKAIKQRTRGSGDEDCQCHDGCS